MNQENDGLVRRSVKFNDEMLKFVRKVAQEKNWPFDYAGYVLLQSAIREKQRKKKVRTEDNPNDPRSGHPE